MASLFCLEDDLSFSSADWIDLILSSAATNLSLGDGKPEATAAVRRMSDVARYFFMILLYHVGATSCTAFHSVPGAGLVRVGIE